MIDGKKGNDELTTATTQATVKIIDVNDETPSFDRREYFVEIPENIKVGEAIPGLDMTVTDSDDVSIFHGELSFIIEIDSSIQNNRKPSI